MFISVDPGENVGVASFDFRGDDINKTVMKLGVFRKMFLKNVCRQFLKQEGDEKLTFIMEDYHLFKNMALNQTGSNMPASRCIGAVEMIADILGPERCVIQLQKPGNLRTALQWAGYPDLANKPRSWHCPDDLSAYSHGVFWLIQNNYRKHPIFS